ncbi:MAG: hypothetical protein IJH76_01290 [Clostridia bacterium]|nr:hypothetical protein [Clostridia bacterium]
MDKKQLKHMKREYKKLAKELSLTSEQVSFLLEQYMDSDYVIGIHNTSISYESFFEAGLHNQTSTGQDSHELSNTINYNDLIYALLLYVNSQQQTKNGQSLIVKIPKKVFENEQGIFEKLPDGIYGIPSQFIVGSIGNGDVIENEKYDPAYNNPNAEKSELSEHVQYWDKQEQADLFFGAYKKVHSSLKDKFVSFIKRITGQKKEDKLLLGSGKHIEPKIEEHSAEEIETEKTEAELFRKRISYQINPGEKTNNGVDEKGQNPREIIGNMGEKEPKEDEERY